LTTWHDPPPPGLAEAACDLAILSQDALDLHTYGKVFGTTWVTIHDTAVDGTAPFSATAAARAAHAIAFKRPENGQFRPGTNFSEFYFDETGDTDNRTQAGSAYGGFGGVFKLVLSGNNGALSLLYRGDQAHTGLDNCSFWDGDHIVFVEDAGDTLHTQRNALDSAYLFDVRADYSHGAQPIRIEAEGRDTSATLDRSSAQPPSVTRARSITRVITRSPVGTSQMVTRLLPACLVSKRPRLFAGSGAFSIPSSTVITTLGRSSRRNQLAVMTTTRMMETNAELLKA